ncbi:UDP-3-O-[3-hydroxymyristoyl] N-acetylglucosamine deacetylase [candidate division WOR-1 bacterium RIFOXYA12_FULL_52_29]|uniref:UDP-3-O-acyl-N-acetylglucosamine deacetylase n=1 Tax=candidate division WOR-1 bacterium RIFOXYC12_FULL_54_18 TaxID=1802584 RepID=A0A1F4T7E0_UNCSA|nr:MAG: UDP-3-O-[3-hydroxymyristoyl] N-acetylglucosamine deacetylase [candidate division WOR-1 bacterium RIFOXYA2_FULL_51_19]OGC18022.1 MAG: UDP-3-O-[3-hydroxymyristoyl] N-acetylglucosamine deacetylase [candidate division WOR-1 bacterium RIFOXYA12_FULL_52_29]OGC26878.1 MAG: UDP-3-O-[3-hydroxymyristoyl] N-acetylglucosamine deacetylase [candidate division WOR-1 bacterium RIFOXYB2_FULL_45_9]OGC28439.1 MAG: UDP-3-O-[3-hydroxymyristoyl] N-acetylglucosamine deacetylase [candidate division WOR-1 bacter
MSQSPGQSLDKQTTIARPFAIEGIGIHSGLLSKMTVCPAGPSSGISFSKDGQLIRAVAGNITRTERGTTLGKIAVVEHFLAAAYGLGIDNLIIEVEGEELPILDGSALPFIVALEKAGVVRQSLDKQPIVLSRRLLVESGSSSIEAFPFNGFKVDFMIIFNSLGEQAYSFSLGNQSFKEEIAPARTFGFVEEFEQLTARGLGRGASSENALILSEKGAVNTPRFVDEPVRHKILDLIGDLALLGRPIKGWFKANKAGHALNAQLVQKILTA